MEGKIKKSWRKSNFPSILVGIKHQVAYRLSLKCDYLIKQKDKN